jgi:hypothetical protein
VAVGVASNPATPTIAVSIAGRRRRSTRR